MELKQFCTNLKSLELNHVQKALSILWFHDENSPDVIMSAGLLSKIIFEMGLGSPNSTQLKAQIKKSRKCIESKRGYRLKEFSRAEIREWLHPILGATNPSVDQDLGYLPRDVWKNTEPYIEKVCVQLNGCFQFEFYDGASVMLRRLFETLIIESYEHLGRQTDIQNNGNYLMLKDLVNRATDKSGLAIGRDSKKALAAVKELGDRSAHTRKYNAVKADLEKVQSLVRVAVDELIVVSNLRKA